ncbi:endonuclease domain-containing protein [Xanthomonas sp. AmX2]|uniref:endonuclease domain-containing protein n=1 Tax=Xanthomonas sp. TaxID=29446 RepID=UPI00198108A7|nr:endonuclease domain-containing protein [Xanthomonas sp.]MBN6151815.1 endonuclease domain-containing protein [Xanthomonas sp.]
MTAKPPLPTATLRNARRLRQDMTDAERKLWQYLRGGRLLGLKFRRQHLVPPYVVDFYCEALKLAVELDGSQHSTKADAERTRYLQAQGMHVLRFWNNDVMLQPDAVLESILGFASVRTLTPTPLPVGEGLSELESMP